MQTGVWHRGGKTSWKPLLFSIGLHGLVFACCALGFSWGRGHQGGDGMAQRDADAAFSPSLVFQHQPAESVRIAFTQAPAFKPAHSPVLRAVTDQTVIHLPDWQMRPVEPVAPPEVRTAQADVKTTAHAQMSATQGSAQKTERRSAGRGSGTGRGEGLLGVGVPRIVWSRAPDYPWDARQAQAQGVATVKVHVSTKGSVLACSIHRSAGHKALDQSALKAVKRWRFTPAQVDGVEVLVTVKFRLS